MTEKIAIIDFPPGKNSTSFFVVNGAEGNGGLVARIVEQGFEPKLIDYRGLDSLHVNPEDYAAVFFASGFTEIRDYSPDDPKKINPDLELTCNLYDECINSDIPVVAFPHGGQIAAVHTGGDFYPLDEERKRMEPFGGYTPASEDALNHWLLENVSRRVLQSEGFTREYREYGINLTRSDFNPLVLPDDESAGPAIAIHKDPTKFAVLLMMHPEYNKNLPAYQIMENVFSRIGELHSVRG